MGYVGNIPPHQALQSSDIADGVIIDADINASAAIAVSKTALIAGEGIDLNTNTLSLDGTLLLSSAPADSAYSGITASFTAGEALSIGEVVYLKAADTRVWKAVSVVSGTGLIGAEVMCIGMVAVAQPSAGSQVIVLLQGFLQSTANFPTYAVRETLYVPEAEVGGFNVPEGASPDTTGDFIQVIGWASGTDTVYFNPDFTIIEHA
jgi:hypothetical protein